MVGCGLTEYEQKNLGPNADIDVQNPNLGNSCRIRDLAYQTEVQEMVEQRCMNCHIPGGTGSFPFIRDDSQANQEIFAQMLDGDAAAIIAKIQGRPFHGGGNVFEEGDSERVETFILASQLCSSNP